MTAKNLAPRLRLLLIQALWLLMALGPFLHAHYGSSLDSGFHEDSIERVATFLQHSQRHAQDAHNAHGLVLESSEPAESPAMVVGSSLSRGHKNSLVEHDEVHFDAAPNAAAGLDANPQVALQLGIDSVFSFQLCRAQSLTPPVLAPPSLFA